MSISLHAIFIFNATCHTVLMEIWFCGADGILLSGANLNLLVTYFSIKSCNIQTDMMKKGFTTVLRVWI